MLRRRLQLLVVGRSTDPAVDVGPVTRRESIDAYVEFVSRNVRAVVAGGRVDIARRIIEPTLMVSDVGRDFRFPEIYAPVINLGCFERIAEIESLALRDDYQRRAMYASVYGAMSSDLANTTMLPGEIVLDHEDGNAPIGGLGPEASFIKRGGRRPDLGPVLASRAFAEHGRRHSPRAVTARREKP